MVIEETGTAGNETQEAQTTEAAAPEAGTTGEPEAKPEKPESFIDPSELPDEIKPHWKRMHRAYTKFREGAKELEDKAAQVDRFNTDPAFRLQVLQEAARQHGYSLTAAQQAAAAAAVAPAASDPPAELVRAVEAKLSPELRWMAPAIASAQWAAHQMTFAPIKAESEAERRRTRESEYARHAEDLTETAPGWEEYEGDMDKLLTFLQGNEMHHPKFGSKLGLLYNMVTGNAAAVKTAVTRMSQAGKSRTTSGQVGRTTVSNIDERVRKAPTTREAFQEAAKWAEAELERQGIKVP